MWHLEAAAAAVLHADPQLVPPQVGPEVRHDIRVPAVLGRDKYYLGFLNKSTYLHHEDFLLDDGEIVARLQLDHFNRRRLAARQPFGLGGICYTNNIHRFEINPGNMLSQILFPGWRKSVLICWKSMNPDSIHPEFRQWLIDSKLRPHLHKVRMETQLVKYGFLYFYSLVIDNRFLSLLG